jgi:DNA-binding PadR family transcriptional regulator
MPHRSTVRDSILQLLDGAPRRFSDFLRELVRPDKTIYVALKQLIAADLIAKDGDGKYLITEQGKAVLLELRLEETVGDLVRKLGPEKAGTVRRCLEALLADDTSEDSSKRFERRRELTQLLVDAFN